MWKLLILLFSVAAHASAQDTVPLVAYKNREVYQYTVGSYGQAPRDFTIVNGENKEDGDFTYIKVFAYAPYEGQYDSFDRRIDICKVGFSNGLTTHLLSSSGCFRELVSEQVRDRVTSLTQDYSFYASEKKPKAGRQGVEVYLNQCRDRSNTVYFTKLTTGRASCPRGTEKEFTESFWAHSTGGLACPLEVTRNNGQITQIDFTDRVFPNQLDLKCDDGYKVEGTESVNCNRGQWSGALGSCSRVSCGRPRSLDNGIIKGNDYFYEGSIEYICNEGYKLDRPYSANRVCQFNGKWNPSEEPKCEKKSCGSPGDLIYGTMQSNGELFGDIARYQCDEGYKLIGNRQRECKSDGTWTGSKPSCERVSCARPRSPDNGNIEGSDFSYEGSIEYICNEGYKLDRPYSQRRECMSNGQWIPREEPNCEKISCHQPGPLNNGNIRGSDFSYEGSIEYICNEGYKLDRPYSQRRDCMFNGQWNPSEEPNCERKSCGSPGDLIYGSMQTNGEQFGDIARYQCDEGYKLIGNRQRECKSDGTWTGSKPSCEPIQSGDLPTACNSNPCENGASCFSSPSRFYCLCPPGFSGQTCASQVCNPNPCQNGGQCIAFGSFAFCSCSGRHVGRNCEISV